MPNVIDLTKALIRCPSVTPLDEGAQELLVDALSALGFECHHLPFGEGEERILNIFARLGTKSPHICYAGHTDVVPSGSLDAWIHDPFDPQIVDGKLYGRGASDMKGSVAAFVAGISDYLKKHGEPEGSISMLITGDEEAIAKNGTVKVLEWMKEQGHVPDVCLVGEPSNPKILGEEIKVGRRGSLVCQLKVQGKQGHVAYPDRARNPLPSLIKLLDALAGYEFDKGTEFFSATNLEITTIDVGNVADNVIPDSGVAQFGIRFNDMWNQTTLVVKIKEILDSVGAPYDLTCRCSGESFLTEPGAWTDTVRQAVEDITGRTPELTTTGGTSDARFVVKYCPVVEFGLINETIHQINENADVEALEKLTEVFTRILELYFIQI
ncbi:MAG: succinyl-diaminopimelate desuccinylase [Alphaproteobacteria bacterium]|nr:succinyl-diaminopimelate desuccinylase [Alphaproteobacteria bacterium]